MLLRRTTKWSRVFICQTSTLINLFIDLSNQWYLVQSLPSCLPPWLSHSRDQMSPMTPFHLSRRCFSVKFNICAKQKENWRHAHVPVHQDPSMQNRPRGSIDLPFVQFQRLLPLSDWRSCQDSSCQSCCDWAWLRIGKGVKTIVNNGWCLEERLTRAKEVKLPFMLLTKMVMLRRHDIDVSTYGNTAASMMY